MNSYFEYIVKKGINLRNNQIVEIVCSSYINDFIVGLKNTCLKFGASTVYIRYIDGNELSKKINSGYDKYIEDDIKYYNDLICKKFCRIVVKSPFLFPQVLTKEGQNIYSKEIRKLNFVNDYFLNNVSQRTICLAPNYNWAQKLKIAYEELCKIIFNYAFKESKIEKYIEKLSNERIENLYISSNNGTNLKIKLIDGFVFNGRYQKTIDGVVFQPNIPCLEIYTSPYMYGVDGRLVSSKPLSYKGFLIHNYEINFNKGKVIKSINLDNILTNNLEYVGEISFVINNDDKCYYEQLLDENTSCHIAIGCAYDYGLPEKSIIYKSQSHIDLPLPKDVTIIGETFNKKIIIFENGEFKYGKD